MGEARRRRPESRSEPQPRPRRSARAQPPLGSASASREPPEGPTALTQPRAAQRPPPCPRIKVRPPPDLSPPPPREAGPGRGRAGEAWASLAARRRFSRAARRRAGPRGGRRAHGGPEQPDRHPLVHHSGSRAGGVQEACGPGRPRGGRAGQGRAGRAPPCEHCRIPAALQRRAAKWGVGSTKPLLRVPTNAARSRRHVCAF